ncbi:hypothetical protein, partial [Escherichia coli]|uniref:hypothetical protein n=1 Tax=Escherichia coli TaxID=562 RepID=UPI003B52CCD9
MQNNQRWEPDWFLQSLLNNHIDKMVERYSCLRAFRTDLFYQDHTAKFFLQDHQQLEWDIRKLMNRMMQLEAVVGFFWVIEWTEDHHYHAHVVFWLDGSKTQNTYTWAQQAGLYWSDITDREGWYHRCEFKEHYEANINIPVRYSDPDSITNIRQVLAYMTKIHGFAPIFPDICYHLTHYKPAAADIPVASDNPAHYADAIRYNA